MNYLKVVDDETTETELIAMGYIAVWGGKDLSGEFFTPKTQFESAYTKTAVLVDWEHGHEPDKAISQPGRDDILGQVDWNTAHDDGTGLLIRHVLDRRNKYVSKFIEPLMKASLVGSSSEATPKGIVINDDGEIVSWPIKRQSLTVTPMEPRLLSESQLQIIKSLASEYPMLKSLFIGEQENANDDQEPEKNIKGEITMTDFITVDDHQKAINEIKEMVDAQGTQVRQILDAVSNMPAAKKAGYVAPDSEEDHAETKSFGDFLLAVQNGNEKRLKSVYGTRKHNYKDIDASSLVTGGVLVPTEYRPQLLQFTPEVNPVLSRVQRIPVPSDAGTYPSLDQFTAPTAGSGDTALAGGVTATTTAEDTTLTETDANFKDLNWRLHYIGGYVEVTNRVTRYSVLSIESMLMGLFRVAIDNKLSRHVIRGSGVAEFLGILNANCAIGITPATNNEFALADGMTMLSRFKSMNADSAVWLLSRSLLPDLAANWTVTAGENLVQPRQSLASATGGILGYPAVMNEHMPRADSSGAAILADLFSYLLFEGQALTVDFSEHAAFTSNKGTWRFGGEWDGKPWLNAAIPEADPTGGFTVSPFVYHND